MFMSRPENQDFLFHQVLFLLHCVQFVGKLWCRYAHLCFLPFPSGVAMNSKGERDCVLFINIFLHPARSLAPLKHPVTLSWLLAVGTCISKLRFPLGWLPAAEKEEQFYCSHLSVCFLSGHVMATFLPFWLILALLWPSFLYSPLWL